MTKNPAESVIRSQSDLEAVWCDLMGAGGFGGHTVWMLLIADDRPLPQIVEITDAETPPDEEGRRGFAEVLTGVADLVGDDVRFAFLRSRPGGPTITEDDRAWAAALYDACRRAGVHGEVVHLATAGNVRALPPDDLPLAGTA
ncbi:MAG: hypothetical protein JWO76_1746 [Nocardioides sp.]|nr:hypothetical protein [Nocardioides sp.]